MSIITVTFEKPKIGNYDYCRQMTAGADLSAVCRRFVGGWLVVGSRFVGGLLVGGRPYLTP